MLIEENYTDMEAIVHDVQELLTIIELTEPQHPQAAHYLLSRLLSILSVLKV